MQTQLKIATNRRCAENGDFTTFIKSKNNVSENANRYSITGLGWLNPTLE
jgi:hypothetical protein